MADPTTLDGRPTLGSPSQPVTVMNPGGAGGTAGSPSTNVTSVQGVASGTPIPVVGSATGPSATFTRPGAGDTNVYASGDLMANSTVAGSVVPMQFTVARTVAGSGMLRRARLRKSGTSITNASFRLHLYTASPTPSSGDNGVWLTDQSAAYLGAFDVTADRVFTDGAAGNGVPITGAELNFALASGQVIYGLQEARGAYTPISAEVFTWTLEDLPN